MLGLVLAVSACGSGPGRADSTAAAVVTAAISSSTGAPPLELDVMAGWPARPMVPNDRRLLPRLLPTVEPTTSIGRRAHLDDYYEQVWTGSARQLTVRTAPGRPAPLWGQTSAMPPWDRMRTEPGVVGLVGLEDPSGSVVVDAQGLDRDEMVAVTTSLTRRAGGRAGWDVGDLPSDLAPKSDGWAPAERSFEELTWAAGYDAQLEIAWEVLGNPFAADEVTVTTRVEVGGRPAVAYTVDRGLSALVWSPAPSVSVRLGVSGPLAQALAVARTVVAVDDETWTGATTEVEMDGCGFYSRC